MLRLTALGALVALCAGGAAAQTQPVPSATVTFVSGEAVIVSASGERRAAMRGQSLSSGDTIETGKGRMQLHMVDGGMMSLQPDTTLRLDDYHLPKAGGSDEKAYMSLLKGGLRTVSGLIGKARPDNYRLQTPSGMIGIRGTEYTAVLREGLTVGVIGGRVAVCNDTGCRDVSRGESAFTAAMSARPVISKLVSTLVPATAQDSPADQATAVAAAAGAAAPSAMPPASARTSGEEVRGYLQALLTPRTMDPAAPTTGDEATQTTQTQTTAPGSFAPPVATPAPISAPAPAPAPITGTSPAPSPAIDPVTGAPAPAPSPVPVSVPGPAPSPAPIVEQALSSGSGNVVIVSTNKEGVTQGEAVAGYRQFSGSGLTEARERDGSGKKLLEKPILAEAHSDGSIAWGRWTDGKRNTDGGGDANGDLRAMHYFTFSGTPMLPVLRSFTSFGSTATTVMSASGQLSALGAENAAGGSLQVTFPSIAGGFATYQLSVPVAGQTFSLTGTALQTGTYGFAGPALIGSTGTACNSGCAGALGGNNAVRGMVGGAGSSRAGLVYGFTSGLGQISGAMVFKP
ncbi:hypothetical protein RD110_12895 [Rhodoferax koreense]|uniref:FecR protein domain-containing protein n=1 Tax=Rhodoferax koreensis TaxID=1842727 RepID=A0A1P8JW30_9BURK|nr:FecR domain-containing protein [Rhodoferax koreense]APW37979.1 hypothetical protein RD110_12895 [Rhodoferax koreense]